jgi:hypothetical protein
MRLQIEVLERFDWVDVWRIGINNFDQPSRKWIESTVNTVIWRQIVGGIYQSIYHNATAEINRDGFQP